MSLSQALNHQNVSIGRVCTILDGLGLLILLVMPLSVFAGTAVCDISLSTIAVLFLIRSGMTRNFSWLRMRWVQIGLMLWVYMMAISAQAVISPKLSLHQALPFVRFIFFAAALQSWLLKSERNNELLLYALTAAVIFIAINTLWSYISGLTLFGQGALSPHSHMKHFDWVWNRHYSRLLGINGKMNPGIILAWVSMPVLLLLLNKSRDNSSYGHAISLSLLVLLVSVAILVTGERTALLELGLGYFLTFLLVKPLRKRVFVMGCVFVLIALVVLLVNKGLWNRNIHQITSGVSTFHTNIYGRILGAALAIFSAHPLLGVGLKQYGLLSSSPAYAHFQAANSHVQNLYLEFLTGTGLVGTLLFLGLLACWLNIFWKKRKAILAAPIMVGVFIAFILRIWPIASTTSFFFSWGGITFWWMGAWLLAYTHNQLAEKDQLG